MTKTTKTSKYILFEITFLTINVPISSWKSLQYNFYIYKLWIPCSIFIVLIFVTDSFDANVGFIITSSILVITLTGIAIYVLKQKCFPKCRTYRDQNYELTLTTSTSGGYANIQTVQLEELLELKTSEIHESPLSPVSTFSADYINVSANE